MKLMIEGAMQENRDPHWIWMFAVAVLVEVDSIVDSLSLLRMMGSSALREGVMFWIFCGISVVVAVSSAVVVDDESVPDLPMPCLSQFSVRASVMGREIVSMAVPAVC